MEISGSRETSPPPDQPTVYGGKTFEQWRTLALDDLDVETRAEAYGALAVLARSESSREAVTATVREGLKREALKGTLQPEFLSTAYCAFLRGGKPGHAAFIEGMRHKDVGHRRAAIGLLAVNYAFGSDEYLDFVPILIESMTNDSDATVRELAANALEHIATGTEHVMSGKKLTRVRPEGESSPTTKLVVAALAKQLKDPDPTVRIQVAECLLRLGRLARAAAAEAIAFAKAAYARRVRAPGSSPQEHRIGIRLLGTMGPAASAAIPWLEEIRNDRSLARYVDPVLKEIRNSQPLPSPAGTTVESEKAGAGAIATALPTVRVTQPVVCNVCDYEEYTGQIEQGVVRIPFQSPQIVVKTDVKPGTTVREGEVLAEMVPYDDPKIAQAREAWRQAEQRIPPGRDKREILPQREMPGAEIGSTKDGKYQAETERSEQPIWNWSAPSRDAPHVKLVTPISGKFNPLGSRSIGTAAFYRSMFLSVGQEKLEGAFTDLPFGVIIAPDYMLVTFDVPESTVLAHRRMPSRKPNWELSLPVVVALADDKGFPYRGKVVSVAEGIDPKTHTQRWQAIVPNKDGLFMPGMSVRVRVITSEPHKVMLVPADSRAHLGMEVRTIF